MSRLTLVAHRYLKLGNNLKKDTNKILNKHIQNSALTTYNDIEVINNIDLAIQNNFCPQISVCTITKRSNPRIECIIELLNNQSFKNFEYLIVDGYYHVRKDQMTKLIKTSRPKFKIKYLPMKPTKWSNIRPALSNARNTYFVWAQGDLIVEIDDCCVDICSNFLRRHFEWNEKGFAVSGSWEIIGSIDERKDYYETAQEISFGHFYGSNRSFKLEKALEVNGYEELLDGEHGQEDIVLAYMLKQKGVRFIFDPDLWVKYDSTFHTLTQLSPDPRKIKWGKEPWAKDPKKKILDDGTEHYSNEYLCQEIIKKQWGNPKGNNFILRELRKIPSSANFNINFVQDKLRKYSDKELLDWRDNESILDMGSEFIFLEVGRRQISKKNIKYGFFSKYLKCIVVVSRTSLDIYNTHKEDQSIAILERATCIFVSPISNKIVMPTNRQINIYTKTLESSTVLGYHNDVISTVFVSKNEKYLASGSWDKSIKLWDLKEKKQIKSFDNHRNSITAVLITDDEKYLVGGLSDGVIYIWTIESNDDAKVIKLHNSNIKTLTPFKINNEVNILVGASDSSLKIFNCNTFEIFELLSEHSSEISHAHITANGFYGITASLDGLICVWDLIKKTLIQKLDLSQRILALTISDDNNDLQVLTLNGYLISWKINPAFFS